MISTSGIVDEEHVSKDPMYTETDTHYTSVISTGCLPFGLCRYPLGRDQGTALSRPGNIYFV